MTTTEPLLPPEAAGRVRASALALDFDDPALVADVFARIFAAHPELDEILPGSAGGQALKFGAMMEVILATLDPPERQEIELPGLGVMHIVYQAQPAFYGWMRAALLEAFAARLGAGWTAELAADWAALLEAVAARMIAGAAAFEAEG